MNPLTPLNSTLRYYIHIDTGLTVPAQFGGLNADKQPVYVARPGFEPTFLYEVDDAGNWADLSADAARRMDYADRLQAQLDSEAV